MDAWESTKFIPIYDVVPVGGNGKNSDEEDDDSDDATAVAVADDRNAL